MMYSLERSPLANRTKQLTLAFGLLGLMLFSYGPLRIIQNGTNILRPDWIAGSVLLFGFLFLRNDLHLWRPVLAAFAYIFVGVVGMTTVALYDPSELLTISAQLFFAVGLFTVLSNYALSTDDFRVGLRVLVVFMILAGGYAVYQTAALNLGLPLKSISGFVPHYPNYNYLRPISVFAEPSFLAAGLVNGVAILLPCVAIDEPIVLSRWGQRVGLGIVLLAVLLSGSIAGVLTVGGLVLVLVVVPQLRAFILRIWLVAGFGLLILFSLGPVTDLSFVEMLVGRIDALLALLSGGRGAGGGSIALRRARYIVALAVWKAEPLLGVGWGQFGEWVVRHGYVELIPYTDGVTNIQGAYAQVLARTGTLGFLAFAAIWISVLRQTATRLVRTSGLDRNLTIIALSIVVANLIDWTYTFSTIHTMRWGLIGFAYGFVVTRRRET
jgi:O-antigen ligase